MQATNSPSQMITPIQSSWYIQDDYSDDEDHITDHSIDLRESTFDMDESTTENLDLTEGPAKVFGRASSSPSRTTQSLSGPSAANEEHHQTRPGSIFDIDESRAGILDGKTVPAKDFDQAPLSSSRTVQSLEGPFASNQAHLQSLTPNNQAASVFGLDETTTDTFGTMEDSAKVLGQTPLSSSRTNQRSKGPLADNKAHHQSLTPGSQSEAIFEVDKNTTETLDTINVATKISGQAPSSPLHTMQSSQRLFPDNKEHQQSLTFGKSEAMVLDQLSDDIIDRTIYEILQTPITVTSATFKGPDGWPLRMEVEINAYKEGKCSTGDIRTEYLPGSLDVTSAVEAKHEESVEQEDLDEQSCSTPRLEDIEAEYGLLVTENSLHYNDSCKSTLSSPGDLGGPVPILANPSSGGRQAQVTHATNTGSMVASVHQVESPPPPKSSQPPDKPLPPLPSPTFQEKSYLSEPKARRGSLLSHLKDVQRNLGHSASRSITDLRIHPGLSRSKTWIKEVVSPPQSPATTLVPKDESHIHPALRTQTLVRQTSSDTLGPLPMSLQSPPYGHRRYRSEASSQPFYSPSQPHSNPPSVYLHSPSSSPVQPHTSDAQSPPLPSTFVDATQQGAHSPTTANPFLTSHQSDDTLPRSITIDGRTEARPRRENSSDYARAIEDCSDLYRIGTGRSSDELISRGVASPDQSDVRAAGRGALQRLGGELTFPLKRRHSILMKDSSRTLPSALDLPPGVPTARALEENALEARLAAQSASDKPNRSVTFANAATPTRSSSVYSADAARENLQKEEGRAVDRQHVGLVRGLLGGRAVGASLRRRGRRVGEEVREFLGVGGGKGKK